MPSMRMLVLRGLVLVVAVSSLCVSACEVVEVSYVDQFEQLVTDNRLVFVTFFADWSPTCQRMVPQLDVFAPEFPNIKFLKVSCLDFLLKKKIKIL